MAWVYFSASGGPAPIQRSRTSGSEDLLWDPLHQELSEVVASDGAITDANSAWARIGGLAKRETGAKFRNGMDEYLRQRRRFMDISEGWPVPTEIRAEQHKLVETSEELLEQVRTAIRGELPTARPRADTQSQSSTWKKYEGS